VLLHENDHGKRPPNHAMEDVDWVHKGSTVKVGVQDQWMH
jgi:hypothetical protein